MKVFKALKSVKLLIGESGDHPATSGRGGGGDARHLLRIGIITTSSFSFEMGRAL
jgi:hypothetical protein